MYNLKKVLSYTQLKTVRNIIEVLEFWKSLGKWITPREYAKGKKQTTFVSL